MLLLAFGSLNLLKGCLCLAVTDALKSKQRWDDTIMIVSAGARIPILYRPHASSSGLTLTRWWADNGGIGPGNNRTREQHRTATRR